MGGCYAAFHKQLGDLVLLEPALARLRAHHGSPVRLFTRNGHADLVSLMPGVEFVGGLAWHPAEVLYCFDPLNKSALRALLAPVRERKLIVPERAELRWYHPLIFSAETHPELGDSYVAEFFWEHTPVASGEAFRPPELNRPPAAWAPRGWGSGSYLLVNATSGWKRKMWNVEGWVTLLRSLGSNHRIVLTSGPSPWQREHSAAIAEAIGAVLEPTTLREFLWLCANARAVLTVDGAASHLAAAFGVPSLTLFGPTSLANWHRASPSQLAFQALEDADGVRRLKTLRAEAIIETAARLGL